MSDNLFSLVAMIFFTLGAGIFIMFGLEIRNKMRRLGRSRLKKHGAYYRLSSGALLATGGVCAVLSYYYLFSQAFSLFSAAA